MPAKKYRVRLTAEERDYLKQLKRKGRISARKLAHAQILIHADESRASGALKDADIVQTMQVSQLTVERVRKRFVEEGMESALNPKVQDGDVLRNWMVKPKPFWWQRPAQQRRRGAGTGPCSCWRIDWLNVRSSTRSAVKRFDRR